MSDLNFCWKVNEIRTNMILWNIAIPMIPFFSRTGLKGVGWPTGKGARTGSSVQYLVRGYGFESHGHRCSVTRPSPPLGVSVTGAMYVRGCGMWLVNVSINWIWAQIDNTVGAPEKQQLLLLLTGLNYGLRTSTQVLKFPCGAKKLSLQSPFILVSKDSPWWRNSKSVRKIQIG